MSSRQSFFELLGLDPNDLDLNDKGASLEKYQEAIRKYEESWRKKGGNEAQLTALVKEMSDLYKNGIGGTKWTKEVEYHRTRRLFVKFEAIRGKGNKKQEKRREKPSEFQHSCDDKKKKAEAKLKESSQFPLISNDLADVGGNLKGDEGLTIYEFLDCELVNGSLKQQDKSQRRVYEKSGTYNNENPENCPAYERAEVLRKKYLKLADKLDEMPDQKTYEKLKHLPSSVQELCKKEGLLEAYRDYINYVPESEEDSGGIYDEDACEVLDHIDGWCKQRGSGIIYHDDFSRLRNAKGEGKERTYSDIFSERYAGDGDGWNDVVKFAKDYCNVKGYTITQKPRLGFISRVVGWVKTHKRLAVVAGGSVAALIIGAAVILPNSGGATIFEPTAPITGANFPYEGAYQDEENAFIAHEHMPVPTPIPRIGSFGAAASLSLNDAASDSQAFENPADIDFFRFELTEPGNVWLSVVFSHTGGVENLMELRLFTEPNEGARLFAATASSVLGVGYSKTFTLPAGAFYVQAMPTEEWSVDSGVSYSLSIHSEPIGRVARAVGNDMEHAVPLAIGMPSDGDAIFYQDSDFFRVVLDEPGKLSARLEILSAAEEYAVTLHSEDGRALHLGHSNAMPGYRSSILPAGVYYIEVVNRVFDEAKHFFASSRPVFGYILHTAFTSESVVTEPNNTLETARRLSLGSRTSSNNNNMDDGRFYAFSISEIGIVRIDFAFDTSDIWQSRFDVIVMDGNGQTVLYQASVPGSVAAAATPGIYLGPGDYLVKLDLPLDPHARFYAFTVQFEANAHVELEPNDSFTAARQTSIGEVMRGLINRQNDVDFFAIDIEETGGFVINFNGHGQPFNIALFCANETVIWQSTGVSVYQTPTIFLGEGRYYLRVTNDRETNVNYAFSARFEPTTNVALWTNNTPDSAALIQFMVEHQGMLTSAETVNYFQFTLPEPSAVWFDFVQNDMGSLAIYYEINIMCDNLTPLFSVPIQGRQATIRSQEVLLDSGVYYIRIASGTTWSPSVYALTLHFEENANIEHEPNDSFATATSIGVNAEVSGIINTRDDVDYFVVAAEEKGELSIAFNGQSQRFSLALFDGQNVDAFWSVDGVSAYESLTFFIDTGLYYIRVSNDRDFNVGYSFTANFTPNANIALIGSDSPDTAAPLIFGTEHRGILTTADSSNFFRFTLPNPGMVNFDFTQSNLSSHAIYYEIVITDAEMLTLFSVSIQGSQLVSRLREVFLDAGTYFIGISPGSAWKADVYGLTVNFEADSNIELESNDTFANATPIEVNTDIRGTMNNRTDTDFFVFDLLANGELTVRFAYETVNVTRELYVFELYNADHVLIWRGSVTGSTPGGIQAEWASQSIGLAEGRYYIRISNPVWSQTPYTINVVFRENENIVAKPNNNPEYAAVLEFGIALSSSLLSADDVDYFRLVLPEAREFTINVQVDGGVANNVHFSMEIITEGGAAAAVTRQIPGDGTQFSIQAEAGTYLIRISARDWAALTYSIVVN